MSPKVKTLLAAAGFAALMVPAVGEAAHNSQAFFVDSTTLCSLVPSRLCVSEIHPIPALEAALAFQMPEPNWKKPLPLPLRCHACATHSLAVGFARLWQRLHKDGDRQS